jgi:FHS family L-fucose permease-like MFS transporter
MNPVPENNSNSTPAPVKTGLFRTPDGRNYVVPFVLVSSLFLLWGFCNGMIDVMDKHFQVELKLSLSQSAWVQTAHYLGYFLMAMPAGWLATRLGYKGGIIAGLLMVAVGGFWFIPATHIASFWAFLLGVCVIASGLTFLETVANPYTTVLGDQRYGATRINLAQSCNGVGWIFGPIAGSMYFYSKDAAGVSTGTQTLYIPYVGVAVVVVVLAVIFLVSDIPDIKTEDDYHLDDSIPGVSHSIWTHPHFVMAVAAQFFYVAAQSGIFSFFINCMTTNKTPIPNMVPPIPASCDSAMTSLAAHAGFLHNWLLGWFETNKAGVLCISDKGAACLASVAFGCFLLGRVTGAALLKKFAAHKVLGLYGLINVGVCLLIMSNLGWLSVLGIFLSYFIMSIMFPTIFALGIFGLGSRAKRASSFIVMAIVGGSILPKLMGWVADHYGMPRGFIVPMFCFAFVALYGLTWSKLAKSEGMLGVSPAKGH